ncbi:MAG: J domain-containing protein [Nitriliruptoraceae bacterium]
MGRQLDEIRTRNDALRELGVAPDATADEIKQVYRDLARRHHPDRGGDPATFRRVHAAYDVLSSTPAASPRMARGRPSRRATVDGTDVGAVDWDAQMQPGAPLTRDAFAAAVRNGQAVRAVSRAPGSRLNRLAPHLAEDFSSQLTAAVGTDDRGRTAIHVDLTAANRAARRVLDRAECGDEWIRRRGSSTTRLRATVAAEDDLAAAAARAAGRLTTLLGQLHWPLHQWRAIGTREAASASRRFGHWGAFEI